MNKKLIIISIIVILLTFIIGNSIVRLVKDFGINNLGKSIIALYTVKSNRNIDYVEISENIYLVKNKNVRNKTTFIYKENVNNKKNQTLEPATFKIYKDRRLYSIVKLKKGV